MPTVFGFVFTENSTIFSVPGTIFITTSPAAFTDNTLLVFNTDGAADVIPRRSPDTPPVLDATVRALPGVVVPMPTFPTPKIFKLNPPLFIFVL